ncbi:20449_t:CDS:2, partial [Gigaspora margarita]
VGIIHAVFVMDDSENIRDDLLQKGAIYASWNLLCTPIQGRKRIQMYPANSPFIGQDHSNHLEIPGIKLYYQK